MKKLYYLDNKKDIELSSSAKYLMIMKFHTVQQVFMELLGCKIVDFLKEKYMYFLTSSSYFKYLALYRTYRNCPEKIFYL